MADTLAPHVTAEEAAAAAAFDAQIDGNEPAEPEKRERAPAAEPKTAEPADERDYEAEARAMGWKSADEFDGDPSKHRDAKTFVELADNDPAVLRQKYTEEVKKNEEFQRKTAAATKAEVERVRRESEARHKQELADLKAERDELIERYAGNPNAIRQINENYEVKAQSVAPPMANEIAGWFASHPEFETDPVFKAAVVAKGEELKGKPYDEQVKALDTYMAKRFPEYYASGAPATPAPAAATNGAPPANARTIDGARTIQARDAKGFEGLPAEAKKMYAMLKEQGVAPSKDVFAKDYHDA
jgi:hypothetical protein